MMRKKILWLAFMMASVLPALGCGYSPEWEDAEPFRFVLPIDDDDNTYRLAGMDETVNFWHTYLNGKVKKEDIRNFFDMATYGRLDKGELDDEAFLRAVRQAGDFPALYLETCLLLQSATEWSWDYENNPSQVYSDVLRRIQHFPTPPAAFRDRLTFLKMRVLYASDQLDECMKLWDKEQGRIADKALRQRIRGYMAGVYFQRGEVERAMSIFQELGDKGSILICLDSMVGYQHIMRLSEEDPDGITLKYLLQDYANFYYEANRIYALPQNEVTPEEKQHVLSEGANLKRLAGAKAAEKKCTNPMMWMTFKAWLEYCEGDYTHALEDIKAAEKMKGTLEARMCYERVHLLCLLATLPYVPDKAAMENLAKHFLVLYDRAEKSRSGMNNESWTYVDQGYPFCFMMSTVYFKTEEALTQRGFDIAYIMMQRMYMQLQGEGLYSSSYFNYLNNPASVEQVEQVLAMYRSGKASDPFSQAMLKRIDRNDQHLLDLIGTKYMRLGQYGKAYASLSKLDKKYLLSTNVNPYLTRRTISMAHPFTRTQYDNYWDEDIVPSPVNVKAQFCEDVMGLQQRMTSANGEAKAVVGLELANMLFQASNNGDLWAIGDFSWSSYKEDGMDGFSRQASEVLRDALPYATSPGVVQRIHYGQAMLSYMDPAQVSVQYDWNTQRSSLVFNLSYDGRTAYEYLAKNRAPIDYVSTCDIVRDYQQQFFSGMQKGGAGKSFSKNR